MHDNDTANVFKCWKFLTCAIIAEDDNVLEYNEFVEGPLKQGKEDCPKSLEIFCLKCTLQEVKDAHFPFFNENLSRQLEELQMSRVCFTCRSTESPRIILGINLKLWARISSTKL